MPSGEIWQADEIKTINGASYSFNGYDSFGMPSFTATTNADAAISIGANQAYPGGSMRLNLSGRGILGGVWDGGAVRTTHIEFGNRVTVMDNDTTNSQHATHVSGTMAAFGINPQAKGMAYEASLSSYNWVNDLNEMQQAAQNGLLVSNHSYAKLAGWVRIGSNVYWYGDSSVASIEDYKFGFYDNEARNWDSVARNNQNYLIVKSSGNNRLNTGPNNGNPYYVYRNGGWQPTTLPRPAVGLYDCIPGNNNAKNILLIGAVNNLGVYTNPTQVQLASYSSSGPTDDGRIKPDLVANGTNLFSTSNATNTDYTTLSGTSMASPSAAGGLLLVHQHSQQLLNRTFKAATIKALAIHTAKECGGNEGPDYNYGWGLLSIPDMINCITNDKGSSRILEKSQRSGFRYDTGISYTGTGPITVTLCWADMPASASTPALNNRSSKLINDLDIRLITPTGDSVLPYKLNPVSPASAATKGDNVVDNVEKIYLAAPIPGTYRVKVRNKGTLRGGTQPYSLIISGLGQSTSYVRPISPRANQTVYHGMPVDVVLQGNITNSFDVKLYQGNTLVRTLFTSQSGFPNINSWTPDTSIAPGVYKLLISTRPTPGNTYYGTDFTIAANSNSIISFTPDSGRVNAAINITGTGFTADTRVLFNGVASSRVTYINSNTLRVLVPNGATTGRVVIDFGSNRDSLSQNFRVLADPCVSYPQIQIRTVGSTVLCPAGKVILAVDTLIGSSIIWSNNYTGTTQLIADTGTFSVYYTNGTCISNIATITVYRQNRAPAPLSLELLPRDSINALSTFVNADSLFWTRNGRVIPNSNKRKIKIDSIGNYRITAISLPEGCLAESPELIVTVLSSSLKQGAIPIYVVPNPSSDFIEISGISTSECYEVMNMQGKKLSSGIVVANQKINLTMLQDGIYLLVIRGVNIRIVKGN